MFYPRRGWVGPTLAVAALLLSGGAAAAAPFSVTTTGTIVAGSDPANLLGAGTSLIGDSYTLTVAFSGLGASYYTDGSGGYAQISGAAIPGAITATIGGHSVTTALVAALASSASEDPYDLYDTQSGTSAGGVFAYAVQNVSANVAFDYADLQTGFRYALAPGDTGTDTFSLANAGNTSMASFTGATATISLAVSTPATVPEPATLPVLAAGLAGLAGLCGARRVRARREHASGA